ncbi:MAG: class I adenylate-forming enzyme family protein [Actinomycetes bacterium]
MGTVRDDLRATAERFPERTAVRVDGVDAISYLDWEGRANALARGLTARGVQRGDRVALLLDNADAIDFHVGYIAAHRAGAAAVPINPRYAARELEHVVGDCSPAIVLSAGEQLSRARALSAAVVVVQDVVADDTSPYDVTIDDSDLADVFYTSGTTGLPKGVASTHANTAATHLRPMKSGGALLHAIPLSTFTGVHGGLVTPMRLGITAVVQPKFDTFRFAELVEAEGAQFLLMVPAQIALLLNSGHLDGRDLSSVQTVMFGGAPTPPAQVDALAKALPTAMLLNGYGLTEAGGSICVLPPGEAARRPGSVGKPLPGVEIRVVDDSGTDVATGDVGEILLHIAAGERRYFGDPEATSRTWENGWVHSGDLGKFDEEGFLYVVDRTKDMLIRGGYNIYSVEVESALHEHPDIIEAAVVGVPHAMLGQDVCAVIRQPDGTAPLDVDSLRDFLADRLADYKRPRRVVVTREPLPRNAMGKLDKVAVQSLVSGFHSCER